MTSADIAALIVYAMTSAVGGGVITALVTSWLNREQNAAKARKDRADASKAEAEADNLEIAATKGVVELLGVLQERITNTSAKLMALEDERKGDLMREKELLDKLHGQEGKLESLRTELNETKQELADTKQVLADTQRELVETKEQLQECLDRWDRVHEASARTRRPRATPVPISEISGVIVGGADGPSDSSGPDDAHSST